MCGPLPTTILTVCLQGRDGEGGSVSTVWVLRPLRRERCGGEVGTVGSVRRSSTGPSVVPDWDTPGRNMVRNTAPEMCGVSS